MHARQVQQHAGLQLLLVQPVFHEVAEADDAVQHPASITGMCLTFAKVIAAAPHRCGRMNGN